MKYCLYRDSPLRPLYAEGKGFQIPRQDDSRPLWLFSSESAAIALRNSLRHDSEGYVFIGKAKTIRNRMKTEYTPWTPKTLETTY